jgi:hypothetical protein
MGKPLMLREEDDLRIESLKRRLQIPKKVEVVRAALDLLEDEADRIERIARWKRAVGLAANASRTVNAEFRKHSRLKRT